MFNKPFHVNFIMQLTRTLSEIVIMIIFYNFKMNSLLVVKIGGSSCVLLTRIWFCERTSDKSQKRVRKYDEIRMTVHVFAVVENVLEYGSHTLQGHQVSVRKLFADEIIKVDEDESTTHAPDAAQMGDNAILVEGLKADVPKDVLEIFFESKKHSGGGEINQIHIDQNSGRAIIGYADSGGE